MDTNTDFNEFEKTTNGGGIGSNLMYLLIGGGIGATLALLFAPKSGAALRQDISGVAQRGYDETLELAARLKDQSSHLYDVIKDKTDQIYGFAAERLNLETAATPGRFTERVAEKGNQLAGEALDNRATEMGNQDRETPNMTGQSNIH